MKNNLKKEISQYYLCILPSSNNDSLEQTVHKARLKINRYESVDSKTTFRNFFVVQFMFIRKKVWVIQFLLVLVLAFLIIQRVEDMNTIGNITTLVPLLFLPWTKELSRSFVYGTVELEISTRFTLRQVLFSRIALIGFVDIFLLTICSLFVARNFSFGICQTIMYLLVPFLFTVIGCLFVLNHFSSRRNELYCGGWCGMIMILFYYFSHWEEKFFSKALLLGWYSAFFVALVIIGIELHLLLKKCTRQYFIEY